MKLSIQYQMAKESERTIVANLMPFFLRLKQIDELKADVTTVDSEMRDY